jgi:hypothetical protein
MVTQDLYLIYKYCLYGYTGSVSYLQVLFVWLHRICILFTSTVCMVTQDLYLIYKYCLYGYTGSVSYLQVLFVWLHRICILFAGRGLNRVWFYRTSLTLAFIFVEYNTHLKVSVRSLLVCRHGIDMSFSSRIWVSEINSFNAWKVLIKYCY